MSTIPFSLLLQNGQQEFAIPGAVSGTAEFYLAFTMPPGAGTATIEIRRPGRTAWTAVQNGAGISLTGGLAAVFADGGFNAIRVTFAGLSGGSGATLFVVENPTGYPPSFLMTDGGFGASARLRVDPGQTGFFAGRMFRTYLNAVIPVAGPTVQVRFTSPIDFILWSQNLSLTQGALDFKIYGGSITPSGVWTQRPVIGVNRMNSRPQPYYVPQCTVETGGDFTGGTELDLTQIRAASQNVNASSVQDQASERGLPPGTYYGRFQTLTGGLTVNDAAQMVYALLWEERP